MTGGRILDQIDMVLRDPSDHRITVKIDVWDNSLSLKWLQALNHLLDCDYHLEKNYCFMGFADNPRDGAYILEQINLSIEAINRANLGYTIQDHFGLDERYETLAPIANMSFKWTSINLDICREAGIPAEKVLRRATDMYGADRIMWGSDIGTSSGTYEDMVQRALDSAKLLNDAEKQALFRDTGRRVFVKGGTHHKP